MSDRYDEARRQAEAIPAALLAEAKAVRLANADAAMMLESWKRTDFLIARAILSERERCAKIVEEEWREWYDPYAEGMYEGIGADIAKTIRSDHPAAMEAAAPGYAERRDG